MHLVGFMIGRVRRLSHNEEQFLRRVLLGIFAAGSLVCLCVVMFGMGSVPVWAIVLVGFFHSIMFPTIFALGVKNLRPYTKLGSSLLVMAIIGGAIVPALMGLISDASNIQRAFIVPLLCHAYVLYFCGERLQSRAIAATRVTGPISFPWRPAGHRNHHEVAANRQFSHDSVDRSDRRDTGHHR